jgi:sterol-4alpha-carboxylate 3-dehydrogenase (decarboxylating)
MGDLRCVVTGGRGLVGRHLVLKLLQEEKFSVTVADIGPEIEVCAEEEEEGTLGVALESGKAEYVCVDVRSKRELVEIFRDVAVVFHTTDMESFVDSFQLHYDVTVSGTRNVIDACWECGVKKLIFASSANVVFDGVHDIVLGDESLPIPDTHRDFASDTKAHAEALVLSANGKQGLLTCALRLSGVFGPGDNLGDIPAFAASARAGRLKFIVGDGENMFDWTYVENVAHAFLCAERALVPGDDDVDGDDAVAAAAGKAYFITNLEHVKFWEFVSNVVVELGYTKPKYHLPIGIVMPLATAIEAVMKLLAPLGIATPFSNYTPFQMRLLTATRTYNCSRAMQLLGYRPVVSLEEGISRTIEWYPHLRSDAPDPEPTTSCKAARGLSKTYAFLGGNRLADLLLWRNKKQSLRTLVALLFTFYFYYASGCTLISLLTRLLLWSLVISFIYSRLPDPLWGISLPRIPHSFSLQLSKEATQQIAHTLTSVWNSGLSVLTRIAEGKDFIFFIRVLLVLQFFRLFGRYSLKSFSLISLYLVFSLPFVYEQNEEEFEKLWELISEAINSYWGLVVTKLPDSIQDWLKQKM